MSQSANLTKKYTDNGTWTRRVVEDVVGPLMAAETFFRTPGFFHQDRDCPDMMIATQELVLSKIPRPLMRTLFPDGAWLVISDVLPKPTALSILESSGAGIAVWNEAAYSYLRKRGVDAVLTRPLLPTAFDNGQEEEPFPVAERVVVKPSGSGMPKEHLEVLRTVLDHLPYPYQIYMPTEILSSEGTCPRPISMSDRVKMFYRSILDQPPKALISTYSEITGVAAILAKQGTMHVGLLARGGHEEVNARWAKNRGISLRAGEVSVSELSYLIEKAMKEKPNTKNLGLGTESLADTLQGMPTSYKGTSSTRF